MSGNNIARKIQRRRMHEGKLQPAVYRALRRKIDVDGIADAINEYREDYLIEVSYHPTKGFRRNHGARL